MPFNKPAICHDPITRAELRGMQARLFVLPIKRAGASEAT